MSLSKPKSNTNGSTTSTSEVGTLPFQSSPSSSSTTTMSSTSSNRLSSIKPPPFSVLSHVRYEHLIAGISGGIASTLVLHPLDLLKVRFAVNDGQVKARPQYLGLRNAVSTIIKEDGWKGLYRGVAPNCWGAGAAWGLYFLFYNTIKAYMNDGDDRVNLGPSRHMLAAAEAGMLTLALTNPIWVVKTRLCLQYGNLDAMSLPAYKRYHGMFDAFRKVYRYEGFTGFYKGFVPGIFGVSHGAIQFMAYEHLKTKYLDRYNLPRDTKLGTVDYLSMAALSKLFAASITYPYQVVRARLQDQHTNYTGLLDVVRKTWRLEGIRGYYKGLNAYLIHVMPNICIVFLVYEKFSPTQPFTTTPPPTPVLPVHPHPPSSLSSSVHVSSNTSRSSFNNNINNNINNQDDDSSSQFLSSSSKR